MAYEEHPPELRRALLLSDYLIELYDQGILTEAETDSKELLPIIEGDMKFIEDDVQKHERISEIINSHKI